jgi:CBS domain-containing protein
MITCPYCSAGNIEGVDECIECGQPLTDMYLRDPANNVEYSLLNDRVAALSPKTPVSVASTTPVGVVLNQMVEKSIGCVMVLNEMRELIGIFSERDALLKLNDQAAELFDRPIAEFMTANQQVLAANAKIAFAVQRMDLGGYRHIPIVDDKDKLTGVISVRDILRYLTDKMMATPGSPR